MGAVAIKNFDSKMQGQYKKAIEAIEEGDSYYLKYAILKEILSMDVILRLAEEGYDIEIVYDDENPQTIISWLNICRPKYKGRIITSHNVPGIVTCKLKQVLKNILGYIRGDK